MDEDDGENKKQDGVVPVGDDLVCRGEDAPEAACGLGNGVRHQIRVVFDELCRPADHLFKELPFVVLEVETDVCRLEAIVDPRVHSPGTVPWLYRWRRLKTSC